MTYPSDDDDMVSFDTDEFYEEYDLEWWNDTPQDEYGVRSFANHDMAPHIRSRGWEQIPNTHILQKGNIEDRATVVSGRYFRGLEQGNYGEAQPIAQRIMIKTIDLESTTYGAVIKATNAKAMSWEHIVSDEQENTTLSKYYGSLGLALDEADKRERGEGYTDYVKYAFPVEHPDATRDAPYQF
jgi:hypothetical protein